MIIPHFRALSMLMLILRWIPSWRLWLSCHNNPLFYP
ncbi:MAG: hypothetical protein E7570_00775 [Ruminococcaceae bacterium]|nr:hypothetical protein [Oscillospiraceae bacterium]